MSDRVKVKFDLMNGTCKEEEDEVFQPPASLMAGANVSGMESYHEMYRQSINNPDQFWRQVAQQLHFEQFSEKGLEWNFDQRKGEVSKGNK
jgi:acetyl-CoA synthetase